MSRMVIYPNPTDSQQREGEPFYQSGPFSKPAWRWSMHLVLDKQTKFGSLCLFVHPAEVSRSIKPKTALANVSFSVHRLSAIKGSDTQMKVGFHRRVARHRKVGDQTYDQGTVGWPDKPKLFAEAWRIGNSETIRVNYSHGERQQAFYVWLTTWGPGFRRFPRRIFF